MRVAAALLLSVGLAAFAQTPPPAELRTLLEPLRAHPNDNQETRGATPVFTRIKHILRDWIESRLSSLEEWDDGVALSHQLNTELLKSGLACDDARCPDQSLLGYLGDLRIRRSGELLVVQTAVGIQCGVDESAYAYEPGQHGWRRFWGSEQNDYTEKAYLPQLLTAVLISPTNYQPDGDRAEHLILTLGRNPWCTSNWQSVYCRLWQTKSTYTQPKLLLDKSEIAYLSEPVQGSVWRNDVLIEYAVGSIDSGVHSRREIRHYKLNQGRLERLDPVVLGPRDFAEWWLTGAWPEISRWTTRTAGPAMQNWHRTLKGPFEFNYPTRHCITRPDHWQVAVQNSLREQDPPVYFLIRWRPPYHFTMVGVAHRQWPGCTEAYPGADAFRTLFPAGDWHGD